MDRDFIKYTWIIITENLKDKCLNEMLITCTKDEIKDVLLDLKKDNNINLIQHFIYKSDEYYMYREGDNYDSNKDYINEDNR
tara:strand:+ start:865 stop:1110 length:246 start_codon:yes stop_codon:yes gene_type:complete